MKTRRFDFNFRPLQLNISFTVEGSVPSKQNYDADADAHTPDYTLTPLIIQPQVSVIDKDGMLPAGSVNHELANVKWYEIVGGIKTLITDTNTHYEVAYSGGQAGRIKVRKNAQPRVPITLEFQAEYVDTRTGQLHSIMRTFPVICVNATAAIPQLTLDAPDQILYDPLTDQDTQVIHASLRLGAYECPAAKRIFVWELYRDGQWSAIGADTTLDYHVTVAADGTSCTVNRALMGNELHLRCRAKYDAGGNPSGVTLSNTLPTKIISLIRRIPEFYYDIMGIPTNIPSGIMYVAPQARIWNTKGIIENPGKALLPLWYIATNKTSGTLNYSQVAHGMNPIISTLPMDTENGALIGLDVRDVGPLCAWEDADGSVFEDADGNVILIK